MFHFSKSNSNQWCYCFADEKNQSLKNLPNILRLVEGLDKILEKIHLTPYNKKIHKSNHPPCIYYSALCTVCHWSMFIHSGKGTSLHSVQFSSVTQSCLMLCDPMNCSTPGLPIHHQLPEFTQTHVHRVSDAIQPSLPLTSPFPPAPNPSQHQSLFQWVNSSHEVAKVLELQL